MELKFSPSKNETKILFGYNQLLNAISIVEGNYFNLSAFEDFNRFIEAIVLYDKVVLLGDYSLPSSEFYSELSKEDIFERLSGQQLQTLIKKPQTQQYFKESMQQAFGEAALISKEAQAESLLELRISPSILDTLSYNSLFAQVIRCNTRESFDLKNFTLWLNKRIFQKRSIGGHFYYIARALVYSAIAETSGMDYAPDFLRLPIAALAFARNNQPIPKILYDAVVEKLQSEIESLAFLGMPVTIFVPPLTANILSKAPPSRDYVSEILYLREKFAPFRKTYNEFVELLKSSDVTIREKIYAKERLFNAMTGIIERGDGQHALNVRTIWDKLITSEFGESGVSSKFSLSGMVSVAVEQILKEQKIGRARALFDLWTDTLNMKNYSSLIEKTFNTVIDPIEVEKFKKYSEAVRSIIRNRSCGQK